MLKQAAMILIACSSAASAQTLIAENLLFSPPKDFKVGYQSSHDNRQITEWVPATETVEDWTQILTVQIFRGVTVDGGRFLQEIGKRYTGDCPELPPKASSPGRQTDIPSRCCSSSVRKTPLPESPKQPHCA
jgi:hypothetical protein